MGCACRSIARVRRAACDVRCDAGISLSTSARRRRTCLCNRASRRTTRTPFRCRRSRCPSSSRSWRPSDAVQAAAVAADEDLHVRVRAAVGVHVDSRSRSRASRRTRCCSRPPRDHELVRVVERHDPVVAGRRPLVACDGRRREVAGRSTRSGACRSRVDGGAGRVGDGDANLGPGGRPSCCDRRTRRTSCCR